MKKLLTIILAVLALSSNAQTIKIKGSDTVLPLSQKESELWMRKNVSSKITVIGGGSGVGVAAIIDGTTDIAMSSRPLKMSEKMKLSDAGKSYKEVIIAYDALSVIINPANPVDKLTREQLEGIFTGKIKNWKQVGGPDLTIVVYSRESSSGTYDFFKEHVMNNKNYGSSTLMLPATGAIVQSVGQTKGAIGYVGFAYLEKTVKDIKVSYDGGKNYYEANLPNAKSRSYPIVRPLYFFYLKKDESRLKPFIDFVLSSEGQKCVSSVGYIDLK